VVSSTHRTANWDNSTGISKNAIDETRNLKRQPGREIHIIGGGKLARSLMGNVSRVVMGKERRFFTDGSASARVELRV